MSLYMKFPFFNAKLPLQWMTPNVPPLLWRLNAHRVRADASGEQHQMKIEGLGKPPPRLVVVSGQKAAQRRQAAAGGRGGGNGCAAAAGWGSGGGGG